MSLLLSSEIRKAMKEENVKQVDIAKLTKGVVRQSALSSILKGDIPNKPHIIDHIAVALKRDPNEFRRLAAMDIIDQKLRVFGLTRRDIFKKEKAEKKYNLPVYKKSLLREGLDAKGYPKAKPASYIEIPFFYGTYAYAVAVEDTCLHPRVLPGEIMIISQDYNLNPTEDYGVVCIKNDMFIGVVREHVNFFIIETVSPYKSHQVFKKDVLYIHKCVGIFRLPVKK